MKDFSTKKIYLAGKELNAFYNKDPEDGFVYSIEASGFDDNKHHQIFYPRWLNNTSKYEFPINTELWIFNAKPSFNKIYTIRIYKTEYRLFISTTLGFYFSEWNLNESLNNYLDRYIENIKSSIEVNKIEKDKTDIGIDLYIEIELISEESIYKSFLELESNLEKEYRKSLSKKDNNESYGEDKHHWWIRYVFVPLVSSGGIAAVIIYFLSN